MNIKIFADGADLTTIKNLSNNSLVKGFTTNPTLMKKAGIQDYETFAHQVLEVIGDKPISFEVFSDDFDDMYRQAIKISSWGKNVYVKMPITNTKGDSIIPLLQRLVDNNVQTNVTAIFTIEQVKRTVEVLSNGPSAYVSVFAGRIADTGIDPLPTMIESVKLLAPYPQLELIWASPREPFNIVQADQIGCQVITVTNDQLSKVKLFGKNLEEFSLETVKMFYDDATAAGFIL